MTSDQYQEVIEKLGYYLRIGFEYEKGFYEDYKEAKLTQSFDEDTYFRELLNSSTTILRMNLKRSNRN